MRRSLRRRCDLLPKDGTPLGNKRTEVSDDPYVGLELVGEYRIEQLIGIGAMGRVYRAHQRGIERDVAIKIIHRDLLRNPTLMARFVREARVASRLAHPNVVQVLSTGEIPKAKADVGGEAYLVMEYLDGISLRSALGARAARCRSRARSTSCSRSVTPSAKRIRRASSTATSSPRT